MAGKGAKGKSDLVSAVPTPHRCQKTPAARGEPGRIVLMLSAEGRN